MQIIKMADISTKMAIFEDEKRLNALLKTLHNQRKESRFCDIILRVCGEQISAHSCVLAAASPYFGSFLGQGQDLPRAFSQKTPQIIEIHIDGNDGDGGYGKAVAKVVDFMYTNAIELSNEVLTQVMEISKIMQMETILHFCDQFQKDDFDQSRLEKDKMSISTQTCDQLKSEVKDDVDSADDLLLSKSVENDKISKITPASANVCLSIEADIEVIKRTGKQKIRATRSASKRMYEILQAAAVDIDEESEKKENILNDSTGVEKSTTTSTILKRTRGRVPITSRLKTVRSTSKGVNRNGGRMSARIQIKKEQELRKETEVEAACFNNSQYHCEDCSYNTPNIYHFRRHRQIHAGGRYRCDQCDYTASKLRDLNDHKRDHLHAENNCSFCDYKAETDAILKDHLEKHTGPLPYFCHICELKFKTRTQLNLHTPKHSSEKPFVCNICDAGFKWKHALKSHMIVHSATKDHLCDVCGFATAHKSQLKAHRLIHTGETYRCQVSGCVFQSTKRQNLKYHMLTHTQEKPHQCEICGQSFSLVKNLKRHMLLHSTNRPFKCEMCSFSTTRFDKLKEHLLKQHGKGEPVKKKLRLTDYQINSSFIKDEGQQIQALEAIHVEVRNVAEGDEEAQLIISQQGYPVSVTQMQNVQYAEIAYPSAIQYVAQVE